MGILGICRLIRRGREGNCFQGFDQRVFGYRPLMRGTRKKPALHSFFEIFPRFFDGHPIGVAAGKSGNIAMIAPAVLDDDSAIGKLGHMSYSIAYGKRKISGDRGD